MCGISHIFSSTGHKQPSLMLLLLHQGVRHSKLSLIQMPSLIPWPSHCPVLIACSTQKWRWIFSHHVYLGREGGGEPPIHVSIMFVSSYTHILCPKQQMVSFQLHNCFAWPTLLQFQHAVLGETLHNGLIFPPSSCRWLTVHKTEMEGLEDHVMCKIKSA